MIHGVKNVLEYKKNFQESICSGRNFLKKYLNFFSGCFWFFVLFRFVFQDWDWKVCLVTAFSSTQKAINSSSDASPYGLGAVLFHVMEDGSERPIGFACRTLSKAHQNYS